MIAEERRDGEGDCDVVSLWCRPCLSLQAIVRVYTVHDVGGCGGRMVAELACGHGRRWEEGVEIT